jgi:Tol biopolymer transport system component
MAKNKNNEPLDTDEHTTAPELPEDSTPDFSEEPTKKEEVESPSEPEADNTKKGQKNHRFKAFFAAYWRKKTWTLPVTIAAVVLIVLAIPFTRYKVLGLFIQKQVHVVVMDSATHTPVSGAVVTIGGKTLKTEGTGDATGKVKLGSTQLAVTKQYYKPSTQKVVVGLSSSGNTYKVSLQAAGRQVPITVIDKVTGKGLEGADIKVIDTEAKTDKSGKATVVVPTDTKDPQATISLHGYNNLTAAIKVTDKMVEANTFAVMPAGKLYFLSNKSGKLDVVKTNLDGSDRQTVLAGTGTEDRNNTSLLASRDWKYLALLSRRDGKNASIYLIDTTKGDKLTTMDEGEATFALSGWSGSSFVYLVNRNTPQPDQGAQVIKSFNAATGKLQTLDQTAALNADPTVRQTFSSIYLLQDQLLYAKNLIPLSYATPITNQAELLSIKVDGSGKKTVRTFGLSPGAKAYSVSVDLRAYEPHGVYLHFDDGIKDGYYEYEDGKVQDKALTNDAFWNAPYPTYLQSPDGNNTFWSESRDGKNALFIGDQDAGNKKEIASASEYTPYGWYTDAYVLLSKDSSELYIQAADGSKTPLKITDYYKPTIDYRGYGGGYGGL